MFNNKLDDLQNLLLEQQDNLAGLLKLLSDLQENIAETQRTLLKQSNPLLDTLNTTVDEDGFTDGFWVNGKWVAKDER